MRLVQRVIRKTLRFLLRRSSIDYSLLTIHSNEGFTLIEVLVASGMLAIATGAVVSIGRAAIRSHDLALERTQATELVQEGIETVRQIRDTQFIDGAANTWDGGFPVPASDGQSFGLLWDPTSRTWQLSQNHAGNPLITSGQETVTQTGTSFARQIVFKPAPSSFSPLTDEDGNPVTDGIAPNARAVTVSVSWRSQGADRSVSGSTLLTNWKVGL